MRPAPDFTLPDQDGKIHKLHDYTGKWLVLYFYPQDDTPGCTTEACSFRDEYQYIQEQGAVVVGISRDTVESHKAFAAKHDLHFTLLSDEFLEALKAYGVWGDGGTVRSTFIIDPDGQIVKEYPNVTPKDHAVQIRQDLQELQNS